MVEPGAVGLMGGAQCAAIGQAYRALRVIQKQRRIAAFHKSRIGQGKLARQAGCANGDWSPALIRAEAPLFSMVHTARIISLHGIICAGTDKP